MDPLTDASVSSTTPELATGSTQIHQVSSGDQHTTGTTRPIHTASSRPNFEDYRHSILKRYREGGFQSTPSPYQSGNPKSITKKLKKLKEDIENEDLEQNIRLKKWTLYILFVFLLIETITIFAYSFFQAVHFHGFRLEEWSFKLLVAATISQITYMCQMAVKHLFPGKK